MSAIAARRAAALRAFETSSSVSSPASASAAQQAAGQDEDHEEGGSSTPTPSPSPPPSTKRRKISSTGNTVNGSRNGSRRSSPKPTPVNNARYFNVTSGNDETSVRPASRNKNRTRRFSPSAPAGSDGETSATGSDDVLSEDEGYEEARDDVDEGRVEWTTTPTPTAMGTGQITPRPSRNRSRPVSAMTSAAAQNTSNFTPLEGLNMLTISEAQLRTAGLGGEYPGQGMVLSLDKHESIVLAGTYVLTPLRGTLSMASTTLSLINGTSYPIFSPISHPVPSIAPTQSQSPSLCSVDWLNKLKLPKGFKKDNTLFLIRENACGIDGLRYGAVPGFAHIWLEENGPWGLRGVHPVIGSFPTPVYPHITPASWTSALSALPSLVDVNGGEDHDEDELSEEAEQIEALQQPFVALVKGPKRSGKSTFARTLLNNLLERYERVAWLECDLGQGEFGCGGVVGLWVLDKQVLGPSFTHPLVPERAHYLGTHTPLTCPDEYITSLQHLIEHYKFELQHPSFPSLGSRSGSGSARNRKIGDMIPLVINTQGWVKGLGEDLLRGIEIMAQPTHIYTFNSPVSDDEFHGAGAGWTTSPTWQNSQLPDSIYPHHQTQGTEGSNSVVVKRYTLETAPISPLQARFTPADLRVLSTISYFHSTHLFSSASSSSSVLQPQMANSYTRWNYNTPLLAHPPVEVEYGVGSDQPIQRIYLIGEGSDGVVPEDLPLALNGAVVALIEFLEPPQSQEMEGEEGLYVQSRYMPSLDSINFLGLAVVRSIYPSPSPIPTSSTPSSEPSSKVRNQGGKLHLLTPLPLSTLKRCSGIIKNGAIELPTPALLDFTAPFTGNSHANGGTEDGLTLAGTPWDQVPFFDVGGVEVVGGERRRFRKNIMRKGM